MSYKLVSCNETIYPSIDGVSTDLSSYVGQIITVDGNATKSYTVENSATPDAVTVSSPLVVSACVPCVNFASKVTLSADCCECSTLDITDASVYENSLVGHDDWGYRRIEVIRPDGTSYFWSSESSENPDVTILPYSDGGIVDYDYGFLSTDVDGVYTVKIFNFPNWSSTISYTTAIDHFVYRSGKIYRLKTNSTNQDPALDTNETYWEEVLISDDVILTTKYGFSKKKVILCISLLKCYQNLVKMANCGTEKNPCASPCENTKFQSAMKFIVTKKALDIAERKSDWTAVSKMIQILKSICSCGGC